MGKFRGHVYIFHDEKAFFKDKLAIVVSNNERCKDNIVNILVAGDSSKGSDTLGVEVNGVTKYVHTGLVTYIRSEHLGNEIGVVDDETMTKIDAMIKEQLGL